MAFGKKNQDTGKRFAVWENKSSTQQKWKERFVINIRQWNVLNNIYNESQFYWNIFDAGIIEAR